MLTRSVVASRRSRTNTSTKPFVSPATRFEASLTNNLIQSNLLIDMPKGIVVYNSDAAGDVVTLNTFNGVDVTISTTLW